MIRLLVVSLLALFSYALPAWGQAPEEFGGHWEGLLQTPGAGLVIKVDLTHGADGWQGTIDIPAQGAKGLPLGRFEQAGAELRFSILDVPGEPTFKAVLEDGRLVGTFTQGPASLPFELGPDPVEAPRRPQEPEGPFPYSEQEVSYGHGDVTLAATLTLPEGEGPFAAVVLITGSGAQNRDEELLGHKPFLVLADHLARAGLAVLRADDRGVGGSSGSTHNSTTADFADDALAGVAFLAQHPSIDATRVGLAGHSEGGVVGPLAASRSDSVAFVVMLAGTGVPGNEILERQLAAAALANGADEEFVERQRVVQHAALELIMADAPEAEIDAALEALIRVQIENVADANQAPLKQMVAQAKAQMSSPWMRYFMQHDPRGPLRALTVPVLVVQGELDVQVVPEQNLPEIQAALEEAGNEDVTVRRFPQLNHLFQHATTGSPSEYAEIEETISPEVLDAVRDWILERVG